MLHPRDALTLTLTLTLTLALTLALTLTSSVSAMPSRSLLLSARW